MRLPGRRSNRRRRHQPQSPPAGRIAVVLDQGAAMIAGELGDAFGAGCGVSVYPSTNVVAVLTAATPDAVRAHRMLHPAGGLVVVGVGDDPAAVAAALDAGADDCVPWTEPRELAARVIAVARRLAMPLSQPFVVAAGSGTTRPRPEPPACPP